MLLSLLIAACGGGGDSGGGVGSGTSSSPPGGTAAPPVSGIEGTGIASHGEITRFGSIYVNGVRYDLSRAQIVVNGRAVGESELALG